MKKTISIVIMLLVMATALIGCSPKEYYELTGKKFTATDDKYELTFEDNFEFLDLTKWRIGDFDIRRGAYYDYTDEHLFIQDNSLVVRTKWKNGDRGEGFYTSWLESSSNGADEKYKGFAQTNGYFEIRAIMPPSHGIWSAFWLMPENNLAFSKSDLQGTGMDGAEIDIYESAFYSKKGENNIIQSAIHVDGYDDRLKSTGSKSYRVPNLYTEFHTFGLLWTDKDYVFYIDGYETFRTDFLKDTSKVSEYMILSMEVGGSNDGKSVTEHGGWAGDPLANDKSVNYDWIIDYVKVYSLKSK